MSEVFHTRVIEIVCDRQQGGVVAYSLYGVFFYAFAVFKLPLWLSRNLDQFWHLKLQQIHTGVQKCY